MKNYEFKPVTNKIKSVSINEKISKSLNYFIDLTSIIFIRKTINIMNVHNKLQLPSLVYLHRETI